MTPTDPGENRVDLILFTALTVSLAKSRTLEFKVVTDSMAPLIPVGAKVVVTPLVEDPSRFDILIFWGGDRLICHYLWSINQLRNPGEVPVYVTRSLAGREDIPVPRDRVLGRVANFRLPLYARLGIALRIFGRR